MSNVFVTPQIVAREGLRVLKNKLPVTSLVHRDYEAEFRSAKIGDTVTIRTPPSFSVDTFDPGTGVVTQDIKQGSAQITLENIFDISIEVTAKDMTLSLDNFSRTVIEPVMVEFADKIEGYILGKANALYHMSTSTFPNSVATAAWLDSYLDLMKVPSNRRWGILGSKSKSDFLGIEKLTLADTRGDSIAVRDAAIGRVLGVDYLSSPKVQRQAAGTLSVTTLAVNNGGGYAAGVSTMNMDAVSVTGSTAIGSTFTIAGVFMQDGVTPQNFVITNSVTAAANALTGVTFAPALPVAVANDAVITVYQTAHAMNLIGDPRGLAFVSVPMEMPIMGARPAEVLSSEGVSVRVVYDYDPKYKTNKVSFDMLVGAKVIDPRVLARLPG